MFPIGPIELLILLFICALILGVLILVLLFIWWRTRPSVDRGEAPRDPYEPPTPNPDYPVEEFFIQNQVIVAGPAATLDGLSDSITNAEHKVELAELDRLSYGENIPDLNERCERLPNDLVIIKYKISGERASVFRAIRVIDDVLGDEAGVVVKEPNWVTGQPYEIEGAPYEIEGAPYEIEGATPEEGGDTPHLNIDPDLFLKQWALEQIGLSAKSPMHFEESPGVAVGIFDSAPYPISKEYVNTQIVKPVPMSGAYGPIDLQIIRVFSRNEIAEAPLDEQINATSAQAIKEYARSNHGLFVAGLINAVAPDSRLYLYKVLDSNNRGDLFLLLKGIFQFTINVIANPEIKKYGAVMNMSLVVRAAPAEANFGLTSDLLSLNYVLEVANCLNAVAVSAAGNSSGKSDIPRPASVPAGMSGVMAVAANNHNRNRACFSNCGDVAAPGGDGRDLNQPGDGICKPRIADCQDGTCLAALIGPALKPPFNNENEIEYVLWSGSSFSAPLATGLAALVVNCGQGNFSATQVRKLIECGAILRNDYALGAGIINIPNTMAACEEALGAASMAVAEKENLIEETS